MEIFPIPGFSEPFSSITHLLAAGVFAIGGIALWLKGRGSVVRLIALMIYTFSLIFLFSMSGVYHLLEPGGAGRAVLMHLDHAAIWVLIAGTFTPIHTVLFRGYWRWGILLKVWALAITGLVLKIVFFESIPEILGLSFYLGMGWLGVLSGYKFRKQFGAGVGKWLFVGGVLYSVGAIFEFARWPILIDGFVGPHEIFHIFVILGALSHWLFIYQWASHPIMNMITIEVKIFPDNKYSATGRGEWLNIEANSREELHEKIKKRVREKYHSSIQPKIHLKYFNEEYL